MKALKISLALIVIATIAFFVIRSIVPIDNAIEPQASKNSFVDTIVNGINSIKLKPDSSFCKDYYDVLAYSIDDFHKSGRLGKSTLDNDQWKENLSKQLYAAYAAKFIDQAFYIFNSSNWAINDLNFIRSEYKKLQNSPMLERDSPIDKRFYEIEAIFNKYDEITNFISSCNIFTYTETALDSQFPLENVRVKIFNAISHRNNHLGNNYLNKCTRLHDGLFEINQVLFNAHCAYLDKKINYWSGTYRDYASQRLYNDNVWRFLNVEIDSLDNTIYNVSGFSDRHDSLKHKWETEGTYAYDFFNSNHK